jgi:glycosyltransferase involved in cell wall biosynthesis
MKIGFDAYFAFHYKTGVAHYGRNLINSLAKFYPEVTLVLFTDKITGLYQPSFPNVEVVELGYEVNYHDWLFNTDLIRAIENESPDVFHGLDHGLPALGKQRTAVTIHDLFFESHPELYSTEEAAYYKRVAPKACKDANAIIVISEFTKEEMLSRYQVAEQKITTCYQTCNPLFFQTVSIERKNELRKQFDLPAKFWLYVGSVIERKNLLNTCKALHHIKERSSIPLMVIGEGGDYLQAVQEYIRQNGLEDRVRFLSYTDAAKRSVTFQQARDIPAFYQMAHALLYPSYLEGFGIPLVEAFASRLPVITSRTSSLPEIGGDAALYVDPFNPDDIAVALLRLEKDEELCGSMISKGKNIVQNFTEEKASAAMMNVYRQLL